MDRNDAAIREIGKAPKSGDTASRRGDMRVIDGTAAFLPGALRARAHIVQFEAGGAVFEPKTQLDIRYYVLNGVVSVKRMIDGRDIVVQHATGGDWLAEPQAWGRCRDGRAICERRTMLLAVQSADMEYFLQIDPPFARWWRQDVARQLLALQRQTERLRLPHTADRITHYLATESIGGCGEVTLPYPNRIWAEHLNVAQETLSRTLRIMTAEGRIARRARHVRLL